jgi:ureidoacrylate peracid hydrolase
MPQNRVLVVIDIQKEYVTEGRAFHIKGIEKSLMAAHKMLTYARSESWPIVHVQHIQDSGIFSLKEGFAGFVPEFEPRAGESVIVKNNFSCYSASAYQDFVAQFPGAELVVIGYGSTMCCLSTIIEGYHRGHQYVFMAEASNAKATSAGSEAETHRFAVDIIRTFAKVE